MPFYTKSSETVSYKPIFISEEMRMLAKERGALIGDINKLVFGGCVQYYFLDGSLLNSQILAVVITFAPNGHGGVVALNISSGNINPGFSTESTNVSWYLNWMEVFVNKCKRMEGMSMNAAQQVDAAEPSTNAVRPSGLAGSAR